MSNEVMTINSEWMNHIVNHLNRMVHNFERAVMNYRPMLDGERFRQHGVCDQERK